MLLHVQGEGGEVMAYPLEIYFGRDTYAFLSKCTGCGKPYADTGEFTTAHGNRIDGADVWMLFCDECMEALRKDEE